MCFRGCLLGGRSDASQKRESGSPVTDAAVGIESALEDFLFEWVLPDLVLVELNAEAGLATGAHQAALRFHRKSLGHDIAAPGHVLVHRLADNVTGRGEAELQGSRCAHRALRIVR